MDRWKFYMVYYFSEIYGRTDKKWHVKDGTPRHSHQPNEITLLVGGRYSVVAGGAQ